MKVYTKIQLDKFLKGLKYNGEEILNDAEAFDVVECILFEPGIKEAIIKYYKVTDVTGFLANYIC